MNISGFTLTKTILILAFWAGAAFVAGPGQQVQAAIHVDADYAGGDSDGSEERPWTTLLDAISDIGGSETIWIKAGTYSQGRIILGDELDDRTITFDRWGAGEVIITATSGSAVYYINSDADNGKLIFNNLTLKLGVASLAIIADCSATTDLEMNNCRMDLEGASTRHGIFCDASPGSGRNLDIKGCDFVNGGTWPSVTAQYLGRLQIDSCTFVGGGGNGVNVSDGVEAADIGPNNIFTRTDYMFVYMVNETSGGSVRIHGNNVEAMGLIKQNRGGADPYDFVVEDNIYVRTGNPGLTGILFGTDSPLDTSKPVGKVIIRRNIVSTDSGAESRHLTQVGGGANHAIIENNTLIGGDNTDWLLVLKGQYAKVRNNRLSVGSGCAAGIYLVGCKHSRVHGNTVYCKSGTVLWEGTQHTILPEDNLFHNNILIADGMGVKCLVAQSFTTLCDYNLYHYINGAYLGYVGATRCDTPADLVNRWTIWAWWQPAKTNDRNSIEGDPLLVNMGSGDFRLLAGSPCINAGSTAAAMVFEDTTFSNGTANTIAVADANLYVNDDEIEYDNDGILRTITAVDVDTDTITFDVALPGPSEAGRPINNFGWGDLDGNDRIKYCRVDIGAYESLFYNNDCNGNGIGDACDIQAGSSQDCNTNEIPDECDPVEDCNSNGIQDICDIANLTSEDCNGNDVPDECEIPPLGAEPDCNGNGIPDDCDVAGGLSSDCNNNYILDECEGLGGIPRVYADWNADGANDGTSWEDAFDDLQMALCIASANPGPGDVTEIWVAAGTYNPSLPTDSKDERTVTFQLADGVVVYGSFAGNENPSTFDLADRDFIANQTILSGDIEGNDLPGALPGHVTNLENCYHVVSGIGVVGTAVLDGFKITGGNAHGPLNTVHGYGGGVYCDAANPMIANCTISSNFARLGGGAYCQNSNNAVLNNCMISENSASGVSWSAGGGIYCLNSSPTLIDCSILENSANFGGGMHNSEGSDSTLTNCTIGENAAYSGGGVYNSEGSNPILTNCRLRGNSAELAGGGIYNQTGNMMVANCLFSGNSVTSGDPIQVYGGGMYNDAGWPKLTNCTFSGNSVTNVSGDGYGGGLYNNDANWSPTLTNCILWGNSVGGTIDESAQIYGLSLHMINYCCVQGWSGLLGGVGNTGEDPLFVDADGPDQISGTQDDNLRLTNGSACIDAGDNKVIFIPVAYTDLDDNHRIINCMADMGAYEYQIGPQQPPTLCSAIVRKTHAYLGGLDVHLPATVGTECRYGELSKMILLFSKPIQAIDGVPDDSEVGLSIGTLDSVSIEGPYMPIELSNVPDQSCLQITVNGITDMTDNPLTGDSNVHIRVLLGDVDGDGVVNIFDMGAVKEKLFQPVTANNCIYDVNSNGVINIFDMGIVKANLFHNVSCP